LPLHYWLASSGDPPHFSFAASVNAHHSVVHLGSANDLEGGSPITDIFPYSLNLHFL